jgi:hypothetical protein
VYYSFFSINTFAIIVCLRLIIGKFNVPFGNITSMIQVQVTFKLRPRVTKVTFRILLLASMSVLFETSLGDIVIDLEVDSCPKTCENFLKLCKVYYYNLNAFFNGKLASQSFLLFMAHN